MQLWRPCPTFLPKIRQDFCVKSKSDAKTAKFYSRTLFLINICLYTKKTIFTTAPNIWGKHGTIQSQISNLMKKVRIVEKKVSKLCSRFRKRSHVNCVEPRLSPVKVFPLQVPKHMKNYVFWTSSFLFKLILCKLECSFGKIAKNFTPKVQQILAQKSKRINNIDCRQKSKNSSTDSECNVDISAEKLSSKVILFSALIPKIIKKSSFCDSLVFFSKWSSVQIECTPDEHAELFHQKSNIFLKSKCHEKSLTIFSGQPIFHQILSVHVYYIFDNCAKNFEPNKKEIQSQIANQMRNFP